MKHFWLLVVLAALLSGGTAHASTLNTAPVCDGVTATNCGSVDLSNTAPSGSELPLTVQNSILTKTMQSAAVANGNGTVFGLNGYSSAVLTVNCATCSGGTTVNFEGSEDASNWSALQALQLGTSTLAGSTTTAGVTVWQVSTAGLQQIRARVSSYSAGTITVTGHAAQTPAAYQVLLVSPTGQPTAGTTSTGQPFSVVAGFTAACPRSLTTGQNNAVGVGLDGALCTSVQPYPSGATAITASATGTTAATTATLAGTASKTTYMCGYSIRANATAAATGNATVTGTITGTLNFTQWTAPNASGLGINEQVFQPCVPASATNTGIAINSAAPGTGGVVSVAAWGYQL